MHQNFIRAAAAAAVAGGFQLTEQSALGLGRAYAGIGVDGTDVSGLYYNPATMTLHTGTQAQFGFVGVGLNLDYNSKDGGSIHDENGRKQPEAVPNLFISHQITQNLGFRSCRRRRKKVDLLVAQANPGHSRG